MARMKRKQGLQPLIPLDDLKKVLAAIARVPKDVLEKSGTEKPKSSTKKR